MNEKSKRTEHRAKQVNSFTVNGNKIINTKDTHTHTQCETYQTNTFALTAHSKKERKKEKTEKQMEKNNRKW